MQRNNPTIPGLVYTTHAAINKKRWDECIFKSYNGHIYSTSAYLDSMAGTWDAIILNDYEAVLPLPWRKKFGIYYIYPPAFTQQLGISALTNEDEKMVEAFFRAIPKKFRLIELNLNATNHISATSAVARANYLLDLHGDYTELRQAYSRSANRNIRKAETGQVTIIENASAGEIIQLHRHRFKDGIGSNEADYSRFLSLVNHLPENCDRYCVGALNKNGLLIAGSIFLIYKNRVSFVLNGNTAESLENGATHLLMDHTIKKFSGRGFVLDFEGSDNPSFARFYEQYGARAETYYFFRDNRLPWPLNLFKKGDPGPSLR